MDQHTNKKCVDHINNNVKDNNITNLRWATDSENQMNKTKNSNNTSGVVRVSFDKWSNKWRARIMINNKNKLIDYYDTLEEAKEARISKANELFGDFVHSSQKH